MDPTAGRIGFIELAAPGFIAAAGQVGFVELQVPHFATSGQTGFAELAVPMVLTQGKTGFANFSVPFVITAGRVSYGVWVVPFVVTSGRASFAELTLGATPTRGRISYVREQTPSAVVEGRVGYADLQVPKDRGTLYVASEGRIKVFKEATLSITQDAGQVSKIDIMASGVNYLNVDDIVVTVQHGGGRTGLPADCTPVLGAITRYKGRYTTTRGFLSSDKYLQDETMYNDYTYMIRVAESYERYSDIVRHLIHPAGFQMIGRFVVTLDAGGDLGGLETLTAEDPLVITGTSGYLGWVQFEASVPAEAHMGFTQIAVPMVVTNGGTGFAEMEVPYVIAEGHISFAEMESPLVTAAGEVGFVELETPSP